MPIQLLPLSNGRCSLEFEEADMPRVASAIQDSYGEPEKLQRAMSVEYRFGGCNFIFQNEWNDPCLISECATGDDVLRRLFAGLTAKN